MIILSIFLVLTYIGLISLYFYFKKYASNQEYMINTLDKYTKYKTDLTNAYQENLININKHYENITNKIIEDVSNYKKEIITAQIQFDKLSKTIYTTDILNQYDSSLETYQIYILNEIQAIKTTMTDKFIYLDHVLNTYNTDIQRLTNYFNDIKIDVVYIMSDLNKYKLDSLNLHKLDVSLFKLESDINDLKYKIGNLNELLLKQNMDIVDTEDILLQPHDIIMDISSLNLNEQYKEISKYVKKHAIIEDEENKTTLMNFKSKK